jgi:hypothetical protein
MKSASEIILLYFLRRRMARAAADVSAKITSNKADLGRFDDEFLTMYLQIQERRDAHDLAD